MNPANVLVLPGWQNSGLDHWQSRWEAAHGYQRVQQHDWQRPLRGDWTARLEDVVLACDEPAVLVAHSLGCLLVAAWAAHSRNTHRVKAALLVAPPDLQQEALRSALPSWANIPAQKLPFQSILVASSNDPYCSVARSQQFASDWGADYRDIGNRGHINDEAGLGVWPQGKLWLDQLTTALPTCPGNFQEGRT
ncbi:MAG: serine hydrolase family protein [Rhodoferax sp.]|nr:serine hydrolase family protein [Rhodoferax sp.]